MKKVLSVLFLFSFLIVLFLPLITVAQDVAPDSCIIRVDPGIAGCPTSGTVSYDLQGGLGAICCLMGSIAYATNWVFTALIAIVVILVLVGAFHLLTAAGEAEKISKGRSYILYAAIGLLVALFARAVPAVVKLIGGFPTT